MAKRRSKKSKLIKSPSLVQQGRLIAIGVVVVLAVGFVGAGVYSSGRNPASYAGPPWPCPETDNVYPHGHTTLRYGSQGDCVRHLQHALNVVQYFGPTQFRLNAVKDTSLKVDGDFGPKTSDHVLKFQRAVRTYFNPAFQVDGIVGFNTWEYLTDFCGKAIDPNHPDIRTVC